MALSRKERCKCQASSIGNLQVKVCLKSLLLILLATPKLGFGQQGQTPQLSLFLTTDQEAQAKSDYAAVHSRGSLQKAVKLRSDAPELWTNLGLMLDATGNYPDALESFRRAILLKPVLYVPNLFLGID
jgi:cytochrome c-type biogenesis protein CcmH/NrfG